MKFPNILPGGRPEDTQSFCFEETARELKLSIRTLEERTVEDTFVQITSMIGRALVIKPSLLMLDEPSAALSPKLVDLVFSKVKGINGLGTAILMVEQNAKKALAISDRGYIMEMGKNRFEGMAENILKDADVRKLYIGC